MPARVRSLSFVQSELVREIIAAEGEFDAVRINMSEDEKEKMDINDVYFPNSLPSALSISRDRKDGRSSSSTTASSLSKIKASKLKGYNVKLEADNSECYCMITGMAIIKYKGRLLAVDRRNCKIKLFSVETKFFLSKDLMFYSCIQVPYEPWGLPLLNGQVGVVSSCNDKHVFLDNSEKQLSIKT